MGGDAPVVYGTYGANGWEQLTGEANKSTTSYNDGALQLTKEATPTGNKNEYKIKLQVVTTQTSTTTAGNAATVLVIDVSGSMDGNRLNSAKTAAKNFIDKFKSTKAERWVSVVAFNSNSRLAVDWKNVSTDKGYNDVIKEINKLFADGGTNLDAGLTLATTQFSKNAVSKITAKNVIALTDGMPTYYQGKDVSVEKHGNEGCPITNDETKDSADALKGIAALYTVCYGAANDKCWKDWKYSDYYGYYYHHYSIQGYNTCNDSRHAVNGPKVGEFLEESIATAATAGKQYAYNATTSDELLKAFENITSTITSGISAGTVTDGLPGGVTFVGSAPTGFTQNSDGTYNWELKPENAVKNTVGDKTTYTYTIEYTVSLDTTGADFNEGIYHALNTATTFKTGDETYNFNVPGVKGKAPSYKVTYQYTNTPTGAPNVPTDTNEYKAGDTVTVKSAPTLDGYTFSGWQVASDSPTKPTITNDQFNMPNGNVVLEGSWTKLEGYTVKYMWGDTVLDTKAGAALAVGMNTPNESPKSIEGYTPKSNAPKSITISTDPNENVIIFEYYKNVTLTANSKTVAYNGETQSISGYTCSVAGVTFEGIEVGAEGKAVGDYPAVFPDGTVGKVDITGKYIVAVANSGMLTIYKATDAVTTIEAKKWLDGDAPSNGMFSFRLVNVKDNSDVAEATNTANGSVSFSKIYSSEGTYIYKLSEVKGNDTGIVYDNTEYYVKVEVKLVEKTYNAEVSYFANEACTEQLLTDLPTFNNTTKPTGSLTISKTVSGNAASTTKEFTFTVTLMENGDPWNGEATYGGVTFTNGVATFKLKAGDSKTITGIPAGFDYTVTESDSNGYTVSAKVNDDPVQLENNMYADTIAAGVETKVVFNNHKSHVYPPNPPIMDEIIVEITGNSDSVVYDGTEHSVKGYTVKISDPRYTEKDFTFTGKAEASGVNAGTYEMGLKAEQFKNTNARFTNVKFVIKADGVLTITPKELTITAGSKTEYGPTPVTCGEWTVSGLAAGDKVESVKITGIQSVPGSSPNVPSDAVIKNAKGEDVTKNYAIKYVNGTLTMLEVLNKEDHFNYIIGTPEGLSLPTANVTRAEVATIFFRLMTDDARAKFDSLDNNFSDVAKGKWYNRAISTLANAGIIKGDPAGTYRPGDPITRAEMAAIIARFGDFKEGGKTFNDISGHWAQKYIELAASNGWINGNPDGTFKPNNNITRAETVAMINRVLDRQTKDVSDLLPVSQMTNWSDNMDTAKWYYRDMQEATNNHKAERVGNSIYEKWTEKLPDIDWASYQI